jgi:VanZ family protein
LSKHEKLLKSKASRLNGLVWWAAVILWMALIWVLSSIPDLQSGLKQDFLLRKLAHATEFGVLTLLVWRALPSVLRRVSVRIGVAAVVALGYAALDELHQSFVPGRHGALKDVAIDATGIVLSVLLVLALRRYRRRNVAT